MKITSATYQNGTWNITMTGNDWPWLMKTPQVKCPDCHTTKLYHRGNYIKGGKRYECLNDQCKRQTFIA